MKETQHTIFSVGAGIYLIYIRRLVRLTEPNATHLPTYRPLVDQSIGRIVVVRGLVRNEEPLWWRSLYHFLNTVTSYYIYIVRGPHAEHEIPISKFQNLPIHALNKVETDLYIVLGIGGWVADWSFRCRWQGRGHYPARIYYWRILLGCILRIHNSVIRSKR